MSLHVRSLDRFDIPRALDLLVKRSLDELHPNDQSLADPGIIRRNFSRRWGFPRGGDVHAEGWFEHTSLRVLLIASDGVNVLTDARERVLGIAVDSTNSDILGGVVAQAVEGAKRDGVDSLLTTIGSHGRLSTALQACLMASGFTLDHYVLRKVVHRRQVVSDRDVFTSRRHRAFARLCIAQGIMNYLASYGTADPTRVVLYVARQYRQLNTARRMSIVAEDAAGEPCAHALIELVPSPLYDGVEGILLDIFVPDERKRQGWSTRLWSHVETLLHDRGIARAAGTVGRPGSPAAAQVLTALTQAGWWVDKTCLRLSLHH